VKPGAIWLLRMQRMRKWEAAEIHAPLHRRLAVAARADALRLQRIAQRVHVFALRCTQFWFSLQLRRTDCE